MEVKFFSSRKSGKNTGEIMNWSEWVRPKKEDTQWSPGRSSMLLAQFAFKDNKQPFAEMILNIISSCGIDTSMIDTLECYPEAYSSLGKGMYSGARNQDLMVLAINSKSQKTVIAIGIEAKVSEPFGESLGKAREAQMESRKVEGEYTRASKLAKFFADGKDVDAIGYQLFTATMGTMCDALKNNCTKSIMLVLVFSGDVSKEHDYDAHCLHNVEDYNAFVNSVCQTKESRGGKLTKRINMSTPKNKVNDVDCWIRNVEIKVDSSFKQLS